MGTFPKLLTASLLLALTTLGCSAKVSSDGGGGSTQPQATSNWMDPRPTITGPTLDGSWSSTCLTVAANSTGIRSQILSAVFSGANVARTVSSYTDQSCTTGLTATTNAGDYRFVQAESNGGFTVEYRFSAGGGITYFPLETVWLVNGTLYMSGQTSGSGTSIMSATPLHKKN